MKRLTSLLCLVLCLCLLPVAGLGEGMTPHETHGMTYYVWDSWTFNEEESTDTLAYYYKNPQNVLDGMLMVTTMEADGTSGMTEEEKIGQLNIAIDEVSTSLGSEFAREEMTVNGMRGCYFSGSMMGLVNLVGFMAIAEDNNFIGIILADMGSDTAALRGMLMEVLGSGADTAAGSEDADYNTTTAVAGVEGLHVGANTVAVGAGERARVSFTVPQDGTYTFYSTGSDDTRIYLYESSDKDDSDYFAYDDDGGEGLNFRLVQRLAAGQTVTAGFQYFSSSKAGDIAVTIEAEPLTADSIQSVTVGDNEIHIGVGETVVVRFEAPAAGDYTFATNGDKDTCGYLYADMFGADVLISDDDGGESLNFSFTYTLAAGQTVYVGIRYWGTYRDGTENLVISTDAAAQAAPAPVPTEEPAPTDAPAPAPTDAPAPRTSTSGGPILFRGNAWGISATAFRSSDTSGVNRWSSSTSSRNETLNSLIDGPEGLQIPSVALVNGSLNIYLYTYTGIPVAGYTTTSCYLYFARQGVGGQLSESEDDTALYAAQYTFDLDGRVAEVGDDLLTKLTSLYGEPAFTTSKTNSYQEVNTWYAWLGADNTLLILKIHDETNSTYRVRDKITITYATLDGNSWLQEADEVLLQNSVGDTTGL